MSVDIKNPVEWAFGSLGKLKVQKPWIERLFQASSKDDFIEIVRFLYQAPLASDLNADLQYFFQSATSSRFSDREWTTALALFIRFNIKKRISSNLAVMTGYLDCASVAPEAKQEQVQFPALVDHLLATYGFENRG